MQVNLQYILFISFYVIYLYVLKCARQITKSTYMLHLSIFSLHVIVSEPFRIYFGQGLGAFL